MKRYSLRGLLVMPLLLLSSWSSGQTQTTLANETSNNTSACSAITGYCQGSFSGMADSASGMFNTSPGNASHEAMPGLEYGGATTAIYAHFMPWFCMQPGSSATGPGTSCNSHLQVGYNSNDPATVTAQMDDMQARGIRGPIIDWYGPNAAVENGTTLQVKSNLEARCSGGSCGMQFALAEDQGSITRTCPLDGGGTDQTSCIQNVLESDFDYINSNYFSSPAYLRVDASTMTPSPQGNPVVFFFICESCFVDPAPNWVTIFQALRQHVLAYTTGSPLVWFVFRNAGSFTHVDADGGFAWVNHYGSNDPYGLLYLDNFYDTSLIYPTLQTWGAAWKGFDNTLASWNPTVSTTGQQCGNTFLQTFAEMAQHNNDYSSSPQLPFMQIVTWNDYEEGTEIETGIDNCLTLQASTDGTNLSWSPAFSGAGSESTVDHYEVYEGTDGVNLSQAATPPAGTHAVPVNSMNIGSGSLTFYVKAVGKASILNKMSNGVTYPAAPVTVTVTGVSPTSGTTSGGTAVTIAGTNFQAGAAVSFGNTLASVSGVSATSISATAPAHASGAVSVTVTNPDGTAGTLAGAFTYRTPAAQITGVSPASGTTAGGTAVTITGANFISGAKVSFGSTAATVKSVSATSISVTTPAHAAGAVSVTVTNPGAAGVTRSSGFTYVAPAPSFALTASPTTKTVTKGTTATYSISLAAHNGYTGAVAFSASGLPSGSSASFSPASVTTSGTTKLSVNTKSSARGTFTLTIKGTNATKKLTSSIQITLTVQ